MSIVRVAISRFSRGFVQRDGRSASLRIDEELLDRHAAWRELLLEGGGLERADRGQVGLEAIGQRIAADDLRQSQVLAILDLSRLELGEPLVLGGLEGRG